MTHQIRKQVMDLRISSRLDAFRTQHLAGQYYYRGILPALEKIFDSLSDAHEVVRIDKLELDLGVISPAALEGDGLDNKLVATMRQQIAEACKHHSAKTNIHRLSSKENICRQWLYYLQHGCLNWNMRAFDERAYQTILELFATNYALMQALRNLMRSSPHALVRIVREHPESFLVHLAEILTSASQRHLPEYIDELVPLLRTISGTDGSGITVADTRSQIWKQLLHSIAITDTLLETPAIVQQWLMRYIDKRAMPQKLRALQKYGRIYPLWKRVVGNLANANNPLHKQPQKAAEALVDTKENIAEESHTINEEGIFVSHAGLVLLHPFLTTFFGRLELISGNAFRNEAALAKAVQMLHYLATGVEHHKEYQLVVPKLLCGMPLQEALPVHATIRDEEKEEADALLFAAIDKWEKLKNVSAAALRENFLQRSGKLYTKNNCRHLHVENGPLDVLLDYLPWNLGIIKLPWMKEILRVEWR